MKYIAIAITILIVGVVAVTAQSKKGIREAGIKQRIVKEIMYEKGFNTAMVEEENWYDSRGNLIEIKKINSRGKLSNWMKYEYDADDNIITEITLDNKAKVVLKVVYVYNNGLRSEKLYYDRKNRLAKKKTYEYIVD
jgi:hypothetical protein